MSEFVPHIPALRRGRASGSWLVYCASCSIDSRRWVYPCREPESDSRITQLWNPPPTPRLVDTP